MFQGRDPQSEEMKQALERELHRQPWVVPATWDLIDAVRWAVWVASTGDHDDGTVDACIRFAALCAEALRQPEPIVSG